MSPPRTAQKTRKVMFFVTEKVSDGLAKIAAQKGRPSADIAEELFLAAYSARHGATGDTALDAAVAALDAPEAKGDAKLRAEIKRLSNELVIAAEREKLLDAANGEVANLSAEIADLKDRVERLTAANEELKTRPAKAALKIVPPASELGAFLASWIEAA